jgi:hypothetical protein
MYRLFNGDKESFRLGFVLAGRTDDYYQARLGAEGGGGGRSCSVLGFRARGSGFRAQGLGLAVWGSGFLVQGLGSGSRV